MGIPRPKRLLPGSKPRAKITRTRAELDTEHGVVGNHPHCLVTVRTWCARLRRNWVQALIHSQVTIAETLPVGEVDQYGHTRLTVYRIVGTPAQLETVVCHRCVQGYEYVTDARVPLGEKLDEGGIPYVLKVTAQGAGPEKVRVKPAQPMTYKTTDKTDPDQIGDNTDVYSDERKRKARPTGSATEIESHTEAIKASYHTTKPTNLPYVRVYTYCTNGAGI